MATLQAIAGLTVLGVASLVAMLRADAVTVIDATDAREPKAFATTAPAGDLLPGPLGSLPSGFTPVGSRMFFSAFLSSFPVENELFVSEGPASTTRIVFDFPGNGAPGELVAVGDFVYFTASETSTGRELWRSNGSGVEQVLDIQPGAAASVPRGLTVVGDRLFFTAVDPVAGRELWIHEPASGVTRVVADITPGAGSTVFFDDPTGAPNFAAAGELLFFAADDGLTGLELWRSDGTVLGTFRLADINPGDASSLRFSSDRVTVARVRDMIAIGDRLAFAADDGVTGRELWVSDGTAEGTMQVLDILPGEFGADPTDFAELDGEVLFAADDGFLGTELWKSDGTPDGTVLLRDINQGIASSRPSFLSRVSTVVYFSANDGIHGEERWVSNGSTEGTQLAADIVPGEASSFPEKATEGPDGQAYFYAFTPEVGDELWRSNGNPDETVLVADINPGSGSSGPTSRMASSQTHLFLEAFDGATGAEPWAVSLCPQVLLKSAPACEPRFPPPPDTQGLVFFKSESSARGLRGKLVAASEFRVDVVSGKKILKARTGGTITMLDGTSVSENDFGRLVDTVRGEFFDVPAPGLGDDDFDGLPNFAPVEAGRRFVVDGDGIGAPGHDVPDALEDNDGDGLNAGQEVWFGFRPVDERRDTDGDGDIDFVDHFSAVTDRQFTVFPLLIQVYDTESGDPSTTDILHLRAAVRRANVVLAQAGIRLVVVEVREDVTGGDDGSGGTGIPRDGKVTSSEEVFAVQHFGSRQSGSLATGRGLVLSVMSNDGTAIFVEGDQSAVGVAREGVPVVIQIQRESVDLTARTLAHELGHILGLRHARERYGQGSPEDRESNLMTEDSTKATSFVNAGAPEKGLESIVLTSRQLVRMKRSRALTTYGFRGQRESPARRLEYGLGTTTDPFDDQLGGAPPSADLIGARVTTLDNQEHDVFRLSLAASPLEDSFDLAFDVLLDTDDDPLTGSPVESVSGVDRAVSIVLAQDGAERRAFATQTTYPDGDTQLLVPDPEIFTVSVQGENDAPVVTVGGAVELMLRKDSGAFDSDAVPVTVLARDGAGVVVDSLDFVYQRRQWQLDPTLTLDVELVLPGQPVPFSLSGLGPGEAFELRVDGELALSGTLDGTGAFSGTFDAPPAASFNRRFVIAMDASGRIAESQIVIPDPVFADGFEDD